MQLGDAATWVAAVGTVGALGFTAYTVRRQVDRERRADDYQRRMYAKRVSITIENPPEHAEVVNDGPDTIYEVGVYIRARSSGSVIAHGGALQNFIAPGASKRFNFTRTDASDAPMPDSVCFVQFTDANGYRWNRYMMGRLEEVVQIPNPDRNQGRASAKLVSLSGVEPFKSFDVVNGSSETIYRVRVYTVDKSSNEIIADSGLAAEAMAPGQHCRFDLAATVASSPMSSDVYCIVEFIDVDGRWWHRYMLGRIDEIGPTPTLVRKRRRWRVPG